MRITAVFLALLWPALCWAQAPATAPATQQALPPSPTRHATDNVGIIPNPKLDAIDARLKRHEDQTTNQVIVVIYPTMNSDEPIEQYTRKLASAWGVGQKDKNSGVAMFLFMESRQLYIQVGSGLEQRLPNARVQQIIDTKIIPQFKNGDFAAGIEVGVDAIIDAID